MKITDLGFSVCVLGVMTFYKDTIFQIRLEDRNTYVITNDIKLNYTNNTLRYNGVHTRLLTNTE